MDIFIAGGTGVLGKRLVPRLVEEGHNVGVIARSNLKEEWIKEQGAEPISCDIFNQESLIEETKGYNIFLHLATAIPEENKTTPDDWAMNAKLRIQGTENMMAAANHHDADFYLQQSIVFAYGHRGDELIDNETQPKLPVPTKVDIDEEFYKNVYENAINMEDIIRERGEEYDLNYCVLRFGWFYSYDSANIKGIVEGEYPKIWFENPYWSMITVDDAADAIFTSIHQQESVNNSFYNVVDDKPVRSREFLDYGFEFADNWGPMKVPGFLVKLLYGSYSLNFITSSYRVSNEKFKKETGWEPEYPTYIEGLQHEIQKYQQMEKS